MSSNVKKKSLAARKLNDLNRISTIGKISLIVLIEDNNIKKQNDKKVCKKCIHFFSNFRTSRNNPVLVCLYMLSCMINGIQSITKLDKGTSFNTEDIIYPLTTDIRNNIVSTVADVNSENSRLTTNVITISSRNSNTTDRMNTAFKEITKIHLSTIEPVQATKGLVNNNTVVGDRPFETIAKSQANIFGNNVINSVETDVSVPNENTVNDATAYPSANPMNNILTTRSNSIAFQTIISANNIVKSVETDVSVLVEHIANVTITTSTPQNNRLTKQKATTTRKSSIETVIMSPTNMPENKVAKSKETDVLLHVEDTASVSTGTTSNQMNKNRTKTTTLSNPSIEMVHCDLLRKFRFVA